MPERPRSGHGRLRTHQVTRGLFILRYVASNKNGPTTGASAPTIQVTPHNPTDVEVIASPGASPNELLGPGDALVLRAFRATSIVLEVIPSFAGGSIEAELHLEPVSRLEPDHSAAASGTASSTLRQETADRSIDGIEILAHVSRRGDVVIPAGDWICGPEYPMAIEGIEIRWPHRPPGLEITTSVSCNKNGVRNLPAAMTGAFAGTRGRAAPITSIEFTLTGERARDFVLRSDALFLGAAVQSKRGRSISLVSLSGREPLVGLRLSVDSVATKSRDRSVSLASAQERPNPGSDWRSGGHIRVFRGLKQREPTSSNPVRNRA